MEREPIGKIIKQKREDLDWSQDRLAIESSRSLRLIKYVEQGNPCVNIRSIKKILRIWPEMTNHIEQL